MIRGALAAVIAAAAMLGGCATRPPLAALDGDRFSGRLALKVEGEAARSMSASFELEGGAQRGRLSLTTPLGTQVAQARWSPGEVVLAGSGGERVYGDLDELSRDALGESVPLVALFDWLRGRPWAGAPSRDTAAGFEQLGWEVDRRKVGEGLIVVTRQAPAVTLRVKLDAS